MEKSILEAEIVQLAKNPERIIPINDPSKLDQYIKVLLNMLVGIENHYNARDRDLKEIAILFRRFIYTSDDILKPFVS